MLPSVHSRRTQFTWVTLIQMLEALCSTLQVLFYNASAVLCYLAFWFHYQIPFWLLLFPLGLVGYVWSSRHGAEKVLLSTCSWPRKDFIIFKAVKNSPWLISSNQILLKVNQWQLSQKSLWDFMLIICEINK